MPTELCEPQWRARRKAHATRVDAWVKPYLDRRGRGISHPVDDFLFTYYSHPPAALRRWHPGVGVILTGTGADEFRTFTGYAVDDFGAQVDPVLAKTRRDRTAWIRDHLQATAARLPMLSCFGLHEWAMVYRQQPHDLRHPAYPLRLGADGTNAVVESHRITCTHFDAFRFFTGPARPLNVISPTRETRRANEQPGCLHAAMDCYKWAYKLAPLAPSELVADCFELAREVRQVDMRAAPYDLRSLGVEPIPIETAEGKAVYIAHQRDFVKRSSRMRARLLDMCDLLLGAGERIDA
ncbi:MAG: 3-methyladenine DNA glycosylase [Propionibacteriales bacterium]|nr:3-methyladenine DNA glycosylase [Propionibacteriales bacterium]